VIATLRVLTAILAAVIAFHGQVAIRDGVRPEIGWLAVTVAALIIACGFLLGLLPDEPLLPPRPAPLDHIKETSR
jgi:hypothetical protein